MPQANYTGLIAVLTRNERTIRAYAYAIVRDFHLVEDIYQEVALLLAEHWASLNEETVRSWLLETTRRKALELRRKHTKIVLLSDDLLADLGERFVAAEDATPDLPERLQHCLERLERAARAAIAARYGGNQSCEEIAQSMQRSVQSVYALLKRARLAIAECLRRPLSAGGSL